MNMGKKCTNTSGVTGVQKQIYRNGWTGRWIACITYQYKSIWIGSYDNFDDAVIARLKAEAHYFKEYSPNYNIEKGFIALQYLSQNDKLYHYIEVGLDEETLCNTIIQPQIEEAS